MWNGEGAVVTGTLQDEAVIVSATEPTERRRSHPHLPERTISCGGKLSEMSAKKKTKTKSKKKSTTKRQTLASRKKSARKKSSRPKRAARQTAKRAKLSATPPKKQRRDLALPGPLNTGADSGDLDSEGLPTEESADSESVRELVDEGNTFEAGAVEGVQRADDEDERPVRTREVAEDDVPEEYLDKDND
jgi:hypothetical protein